MRPALSITLSSTVYSPSSSKMCAGCCSVLVPPSPKSQPQLTIVLPGEVVRSVKWTFRPSSAGVDEKAGESASSSEQSGCGNAPLSTSDSSSASDS